MDQRTFSKINGKVGCGWMGRMKWVDRFTGWVENRSGRGEWISYLQQSFLRMKMAFKIRTRNSRREEVLVDTVEDIIGDGPEGSQFLRIFVGNLDTKFFFDGHEGLQEIEGVKPEIVI